jgi:hypothetical protein
MAKLLRKSFPADYPDLLKDWHWEKNQEIDIDPHNLRGKRGEKVFWQCKEGHVWRMLISKRTIRNQGCPYCSGHRATPTTSIRTTKPHLVPEWHPTKNGDMTPDDVSTWSDRKVWWLCPEGDEYLMSVANRSQGRSCHFCCGRHVREGASVDLTHPELMKEWHPTKNQNIDPKNYSFGSDKNVWWQCSLGHEWENKIEGRAVKNTGCPYCSGNRLLKGFNTLADKYPHIASQWHKWNDLKTTEILAGSTAKAWWKCPNNQTHIWKARINRRTTRGCPYCGQWKMERFLSLLEIHDFWDKDLSHQRKLLTKFGILTFKGIAPVIARSLYADILTKAEIKKIRYNNFSAHLPFDLAKRLVEESPYRPSVGATLKKKILEQNGHQCQLCKSPNELQVDHFIPWAKGGEHDPSNFWTLCKTCNYAKRDYWPTPEMHDAWLATGRELPPTAVKYFAAHSSQALACC